MHFNKHNAKENGTNGEVHNYCLSVLCLCAVVVWLCANRYSQCKKTVILCCSRDQELTIFCTAFCNICCCKKVCACVCMSINKDNTSPQLITYMKKHIQFFNTPNAHILKFLLFGYDDTCKCVSNY